ncbi:MAG: aminodeoxychorismate synthase component I [Candidatus Omnitrophota bacterium]
MNILNHTIPFREDCSHLLDIFKDEPNLFFLDSSLSHSKEGEFSYLGFSPFKVVKTKSFDHLRKTLKPYLGLKSKLTFPGGAIGCIGYDGEMWFGLYQGLICVDHNRKLLTITSTGRPFKSPIRQRREALKRKEYILNKIIHYRCAQKSIERSSIKLLLKSNTSQREYQSAVKKALQHIHRGDIYQINLSHRYEVGIKQWQKYVHPVEIYKQLRALSPSNFSAYMNDGQRVILSSSPERFLKLTGNIVQVKPMKGTRPRGKTSREDQSNKIELVQSDKEKAELLMVTDLERNDLGRVCSYGSVNVKAMRTIEEYKTVFQATSTVEGRLHEKFDQFDLLRATFPSGSVTGCPKIEAMKIIRKIEKAKRGVYTGALGYISFTGNMDFNVLIRTILLEKDKISFYVGGGIVADSNPQKEYEETLVKSQAMVAALRKIFR